MIGHLFSARRFGFGLRALFAGVLLLNAVNAMMTRAVAAPTGPALTYPILFVTQVPIAADFTTIGSTFGNHHAGLYEVGRGGDLWIRYPDGTLKNLTAAAGYGSPDEFQGDEAIAVRDPSVHWDGTKAVFSMAIGAATEQYEYEDYYWQLYEVTGLGQGETPVITLVPNQPQNFNNISPIYGTDGRLLFTSDRPRNGAPHLYPQRDEYELAPVVSGLWSLDPATGDLRLLNHAPSGDFTPIIDSFGRVVFTQWDHLQRDQLADADESADTPDENCYSGGDPTSLPYGTFNYLSEDSTAYDLDDRTEVFPEPRSCRADLLAETNLDGHGFNHFFPWTIAEDGRDGEVLSHLGRHELHSYIPRSINDDPDIVEYYGQYPVGGRFNPNPIENMFQIKEDPLRPGAYYGVDAPEFYTHAAGRVISMTAPPTLDADHIAVTYVTDEPSNAGHFREPLPLSDGTLMAVHTSQTDYESGSGTSSTYDFRLKTLTLSGGYWVADQPLTSGIVKTVSYWSPDDLVTFSGALWELNPVEVRPRTPPTPYSPTLGAPELQMFAQAGVDVADLQAYLTANNLALAVSRNVTTRDDMDEQQPFNLRVPGGVQTIGTDGKIYDVAYLQFFQGDQLRGLTGGYGSTTPREGRRVLPQILHDPNTLLANPPATGPQGSVALAGDGSMAAFVPARRAMTWQLTDSVGVGVVRERYWVTFQPGEIRVCTSCHGLSQYDQAGQTAPTNPPQALYDLLEYWKSSTFIPVHDLRVTNAVNAGGTLTATLEWTPPPTAITLTLRYGSSLITEANWASTQLLSEGLSGSTNSYTAIVPYTSGTLYFALVAYNANGDTTGVSNNAFWPYWRLALPSVRR